MQEFEFEVLEFIRNNLKNGFLDTVMPMVTMCGNMGIFWVVAALVLSAKAKYRKCSIAMLIGLILGVLIGNFLVKNAVQRDRPCWIVEVENMLISNPQDFSFPSGHTLSSFCAATILFHYNKVLGIPAYVIASLIAFSRLYLYVHFPTDIAGGVVLGIMVAILSINVTEKYIFKQKPTAESE